MILSLTKKKILYLKHLINYYININYYNNIVNLKFIEKEYNEFKNDLDKMSKKYLL